ncbi:hypothetical protein KVT40_006956 [Elsinoe batatas]|uniref:F-box domain-containing protein n=1 Tax=Elsinoe batatas TaxID=2601811 RepID=A0A8K0KXS0_9PEZI|nr:hypothetical protein KVT40_006956 [Elsinoe batatas]
MEVDGGDLALPVRTVSPVRNAQPSSPRRLHLLDLPVDVLNQIVKHITHTNDLTSTALVHSALHALAIPQIYNRFDIVWPDGSTAGEPRGGVDALTYGLATLNMAEDVFGEADWQRERRQIGNVAKQGHPERQTRRRRGNYYARYIRKFSLGNGPPDWVEEYLTNKEAGKMLGTLVALAIARMKNLETFVWDMPTGVICDVWTSLSYLGDREDGEQCRLEKIWIRWHRNTHLYPQIPLPALDPNVPLLRIDQSSALARTEHPSFSILPPLKSLSVLDIDEMQYLDEMSVLIGRSLDKLRELRVGIAVECRRDDWTADWTGDDHEQIDLSNPVRSTFTIGGRRRGGILGALTSAFLDLKQRDSPRNSIHRLRRRSGAVPLVPSPSRAPNLATVPVLLPAQHQTTAVSQIPADTNGQIESAIGLKPPQESIRGIIVEQQTDPFVQTEPVRPGPNQDQGTNDIAQGDEAHDEIESLSSSPTQSMDAAHPIPSADNESAPEPTKSPVVAPSLTKHDSENDDKEEVLSRKLTLETLELEWVPLSIPVLQAAFDWSKLTSITLLDCEHHDELWTALHDEYAKDLRAARGALLGSPRPRRQSVSIPHPSAVRLRLKHIHVNTVTLPLIRFINECLAPNTLESLYLQEFSGSAPIVTLDTIFNAVIKLHRLSLRSLLLDSCKRRKNGAFGRGSSWRRWALTQDLIRYITTPAKLPSLRELGFCIDYAKDWSLFKQRLPSLPRLRSLYIPRYTIPYDHPDPSPKDLANQLLDAVLYNDAMDLCYMGIYDKCFEIMEGDPDRHRDGAVGSSSRPGTAGTGHGHVEESSDEEEDEDEEDDEDDEDEEEHLPNVGGEGRGGGAGDFEYVGSESEEESEVGKAKLHIREILFYDDKVPIFRVRHGKL